MELCDLHTHSIFSDGTCSPKEVLILAKEAGLSAVALTDHNTIEGIDFFLEESKNFDIEAIGERHKRSHKTKNKMTEIKVALIQSDIHRKDGEAKSTSPSLFF